jgi:hypothetical protein
VFQDGTQAPERQAISSVLPSKTDLNKPNKAKLKQKKSESDAERNNLEK